jgi:sugar phosphate isomerase/epimerase
MTALTSLQSRAAGGGTGPLGKPIGIQLYTVREDANRDLPGTLKRLATIGYKEVETAGFYGKSGKELRAIFTDHGLSAPSAHTSMTEIQKNAQKLIDGAAELGAKYLVCSFPALPDGAAPASGKTLANTITLDHWKWNADQLNRFGELAKKAGLRAGYHNHNMEFRNYGGKVGFDQLLQWTDPALITFELDLGWVVTAGADPVAYLKKHSQRISLLHVKDLRKDAVTLTEEVRPQTTEVGSGRLDWKSIFAACDPKQVQHYFVEQENFEQPALEAVAKSYEYLSTLKA